MISVNIVLFHLFEAGSIPVFTEGYDIRTLRRFMEVFPDLSQTDLIRGYFSYMGIPLNLEDEEEVVQQTIAEDYDPFSTVLVNCLRRSPLYIV